MALAGVAAAEEAAETKEELVPIKVERPRPWIGSLPWEPSAQNLEPPREGKPYPPILVPKGCDQLLSRGCKVTSSDPNPIYGELSMVTDGVRDKYLDNHGYSRCLIRLVLNEGLQWIQIDLGEQKEIYAVWVWHIIAPAVIYKDVIVQISDDPNFVDGVVTIFNNDHDNSAGLGTGKDFEYIETNHGRPIPANGTKGRYVRCYSNGSYSNSGASGIRSHNAYIHVEVFGRKGQE